MDIEFLDYNNYLRAHAFVKGLTFFISERNIEIMAKAVDEWLYYANTEYQI